MAAKDMEIEARKIRTHHRLPRLEPINRRNHIVSVAAAVFAEEGYGASSMSSIAARLGGSKATLYKYFSSKQQLFEAVMERFFERALAPLRDLRSGDDDALEEILSGFGARFLEMIYDTSNHDVHRLVHSEGSRFPELATAFFRSGPNAVIDELAFVLRRFADAGKIFCEDIELAAGQFLGMLRGDRHIRFVTGALPAPDETEILRHARQAARIFVGGVAVQQLETGSNGHLPAF